MSSLRGSVSVRGKVPDEAGTISWNFVSGRATTTGSFFGSTAAVTDPMVIP
jgi:hypothetical protein